MPCSSHAKAAEAFWAHWLVVRWGMSIWMLDAVHTVLDVLVLTRN